MVTAYCVKCRRKETIKGDKKVSINTKRGTRYAIKGKCSKCGTNVYRFVAK